MILLNLIMKLKSNSYPKYVLPLLVFITLIFYTCGVDDWQRKVEWDEYDLDHLPSQKDFPNSEAVVLLDEGQVQIFTDGALSFSTYDRHIITKIFNSRGHRLANVVVAYGNQNSVEEIEARTISPDGKITVLDPKNIFDVNLYPNFVFYSDQRAKIFTLPAVVDGCIIEYRYHITIRSQTYGSFWRFQTTIPVKISRFKLTKPAPWELDFRIYDINIKPDKKVLAAGQINVLEWEARDLDAIETEVAMPALNELGARLALRPVGVNSWQDISNWYNDLIKSQISIDEEIEQIVHELTTGLTEDKEKLRALFEWVRDQVRYVSVSIGIGGYQPHPVTEIMRNRYGDCKDMTTLLCSMANAAGLDVYQALISTRLNGKPDTTLPSTAHFNHVIAYAPALDSNGVWMDATEKTAAFGQLPWYDQGMPVLVVQPDGFGKIRETPKLDYSENRSKMVWQIQIESSGSAKIKGKTIAFGTVANEMREELSQASQKEIKDWLNAYVEARARGTNLLNFEIQGLKPITYSLEITYELESSHFARKVNNNLVILPGQITNFNLADYFQSNERIQDIVLRFPSTKEVEIQVELPEGYSIIEHARTDSLISSYGRYSRKFSQADRGFSLVFRYELSQDLVPSIEYSDFKKFLEEIRIKDLDEIAIKATSPQVLPDYLRELFKD
jgi:hypothetical protein